MTYQAWKKAVLASLDKDTFRATAEKFGITTTSLQNFKKAALAGEEFAGMTTYKHWVKKQVVK